MRLGLWGSGCGIEHGLSTDGEDARVVGEKCGFAVGVLGGGRKTPAPWAWVVGFRKDGGRMGRMLGFWGSGFGAECDSAFPGSGFGRKVP